MRSAFGEPPCSGVNVPASAGTAATSRIRAAARAARTIVFRFERKAGATIRGSWSGPPEGRIALLDECGHAFGHVLSAEKRMLDVGFELELSVQIAVEHPVERPLRSGVGLGRALGQLLGQLERLLRQRLGFDDAVDEAPVERLLCR